MVASRSDRRGGTSTHTDPRRPTRRNAAARKPAIREARRFIEGLELRRLLATVAGTAGNDTITVAISGANIVVTVNGTPNNFTDATNSTIVINAGDGNDTITVNGNSDNLTTINGGLGDDSVVVGGGDYDNNFATGIVVTGGTGAADVIRVNDAGDGLGSDTYNITGTTFVKAFGGTLSWDTAVESFVLDASANPDTINLNATTATTLQTINAGDGNDSVIVGNGDYDSNIFGSLTVNGGVGTDTVQVQDAADGGGDAYTLDTSFSKSSDTAVLAVSSDFFTLSGPTAATAEVYNINRYVGQVLVGAGAGDDVFNLGNGDYDTNLSLVTLQGDAGADVLNYNDQTDGAADTNIYDISAASIQKGNVNNVVNHTGLESVVINGSPNADTYDINTTASAIPVTINAGAGNDNLIAAGVGVFINDIDNAITNALTFNGGADLDRITLDDSGDSADNETYTLSNTSFAKSSATFGSLSFDGTSEVFDLLANAGNNPINVGSFPNDRSVTVNGGAGNDTISTNNANFVLSDTSTLSVVGGAGTDAWVINDSGDVDAATYRLTFNTFKVVAGNLSGLYSYDSTIESLQFTGGSSGTEFDIDSLNATPALLLDLGDGNDTLVVGGGDIDSNIFQNLTLAGGAGTDSLVFDDAADGVGSDTVTMVTGITTKNTRAIAYNTFEAQQYLGNAQATVFTVDSGNLPTTITGGSGNEFVSVAPTTDDIDAFASTLVFDGGTGSDTLSLNDTLDAGDDTYNISSNGVTKPGAGAFQGLIYASVERLGISAGAANHTFNLLSTLAGTTYPINAGGGNDTFNVGGTDNIADGQAGTVTLNGEAGTDVLNYNDSASGVARTFIIRNTRVDRPDTGIIDFPATESAVFTSGVLNDAFNVLATAATTPVTINAGDGNDTVNVGDGLLGAGADLNAALTVDTAFGLDVVNVGAGDLDELVGPVTLFDAGAQAVTVNDTADAGSLATGYTILNGTFTRAGAGTVFGGLNFSFDSQVLFDFNQSGTPITLNATTQVLGAVIQGNGGIDTITIVNAPDSVTVRGGAGLDSIDVNSDAAGVAIVAFDQNEDFDSITNRVGGRINAVGNIAIRANVTSVASAASSGILNLNAATLVVPSGNLSTYTDALERGYNGGGWNSTSNGSFVSTTAAATTVTDALGYAVIGTGVGQLNTTNVHGVAVAAGDLVVTYTLAGDADLDRDVDFNDLLTLSQNYAPAVGAKNWRQGNFNYNTPDTAVSAVGFPDLLALSQNYGTSALTSGTDLSGTELMPAERRRVQTSTEGDVLVV